MTGGRCSSYTDEENQALAQECGIIGPIEAQKEISGDPAPSGRRARHPGMLITDEEITERFGDVLPKLDADPTTRAYEPYWHGKRNRMAVEKAMQEKQS
jgi:hypothetical protein